LGLRWAKKKEGKRAKTKTSNKQLSYLIDVAIQPGQKSTTLTFWFEKQCIYHVTTYNGKNKKRNEK